MKIGNPSNYYVRVRSASWEEPDDVAPLYEGIYSIDLNHGMAVQFVPDVAAMAPPWSGAGLPHPSAFTTTAQARILHVLMSSYAVTPNAARAGTEERFTWSWTDEVREPTTVFYVTADEFARYAGDLEDLSEIAGGLYSPIRRSDVVDRPAVRFIEDRILASSWLEPSDAASIGRNPLGGTT